MSDVLWFIMALSMDFSLLESGKLELMAKGLRKSRLTIGVELFGSVLSTLVLTAMSTKLTLFGM